MDDETYRCYQQLSRRYNLDVRMMCVLTECESSSHSPENLKSEFYDVVGRMGYDNLEDASDQYTKTLALAEEHLQKTIERLENLKATCKRDLTFFRELQGSRAHRRGKYCSTPTLRNKISNSNIQTYIIGDSANILTAPETIFVPIRNCYISKSSLESNVMINSSMEKASPNVKINSSLKKASSKRNSTLETASPKRSRTKTERKKSSKSPKKKIN